MVARAVVSPEILVDVLEEIVENGRAGTKLGLHVGNNSHVSKAPRDAALVLSGGGINGVLLELGFLKRLRETPLWNRVGWIYGTSAGAVAGAMAALDRLDDLETFLLSLHADDVFRPRRMWQLPLGGLRDYTLPATIATRLGQPDELGARLAGSEIELVVFATDVSDHVDADGTRSYELAYSSHTDSRQRDGARDPRVSGGERSRPPHPDRRRHRDGRRLGPELPARVRRGEPGSRRSRRLPVHRELSAARRVLPRTAA